MSLLIAPLEVLTDPRLSDPERRVLLALFSFRGRDTNTVWPSLEAIGQRAHVKDPARVSKLTTSLSKKGWLSKRKKGFTGGNTYELSVPEIAECGEPSCAVNDAKLEQPANLDSPANLAPETKLEPETKSNLVSQTKSNLVPETKCKEQTIEQTIEQEKPASSPAGDSAPDAPAQPAPPRKDPVPYQAVVDLYHEILPDLSAVKILNTQRKAAVRQRHTGLMDKSLDNWRAYFEAACQSDFLMGRIEGKPWRADFDFLISERAATRLIEGKYHEKTRHPGNPVGHPARAPTPAERVAAKRRAAAQSSDLGAVVEDVGNVRPHLAAGSGR